MKNFWIFVIVVIIPVSIKAAKSKPFPSIDVLGNNYTRKTDQKGSIVSEGPKNGRTGLKKMSSDLYLAINSIDYGHTCSSFLEPGFFY